MGAHTIITVSCSLGMFLLYDLKIAFDMIGIHSFMLSFTQQASICQAPVPPY